jgi:glycosyltransferase involved in cell wall biosynthesis/ribosomal protein S18 acetylase RimI-like enzyme
MKVAHLTTVDISLRFLVLPQLKAILDREGEALGISAPGPWVPELEAAGIRHLPLVASTRGVNPLSDLRAAWQLWRVLRRQRPDILHTHNPKPGLYGRVLGRMAGVPIVVNTVHGVYATRDDDLWKRVAVYLLEALAARFSDAELLQSSEDFELLTRWRIVPPERARLLGNGVDLARFDPDRFDDRSRQGTRQELRVAEDQILVGAVGRLVAEKGYPELFEAASLLDDRFVVVAIGPEDPAKSDSLAPEMLENARRAGIRLLGMRTDVDAIYRAMDVFVLPSHREGFPRAAMEAAAMSLPIVATDIRGCREVVEHGFNGLLVPVANPHELAAAIRKLGDDPILREDMGRAGYQKARDHFDERRIVQTVLQTYRAVARRKGLRELSDKLRVVAPEAVVRPAIAADAMALAVLHARNIETGFLRQLGHRFLSVLYRTLISWSGAVVLVADDGSGPAGFVAGVTDTGKFYRHFMRHSGLRAALVASPRLLNPRNLFRVVETFRYGDRHNGVRAELLSMAVATDSRGLGLSVRLGREFLAAMEARRVGPVKVVVGSSNTVALRAYEKIGFAIAESLEVHQGESSVVLLWSA